MKENRTKTTATATAPIIFKFMQKWDYNDYVAGDDGGDTDGYDANRKGNADSVQQLKKKQNEKKPQMRQVNE